MGIGYHREEIAAFPPSKFEPKRYTWLINGIGYLGYVGGVLFIGFALIIIFFPGLRAIYFNNAIAAVISAIILFIFSTWLIRTFGVKYFYISENAFAFATPLGNPTVISKDEIIHIDIKRPNPAMSLIPITSPSILFATYDELYQFRTSRWVNEQELLDTFESLSQQLQDPFAEYYHRSKTTIYSFLIRMSQDTAGMMGLTIITIYLFLAVWGGIAMLIDGIKTGQPYVLFLRNPDFLNGDLPGYNWDIAIFHPPSNDFWFGTDFLGRDIFARLIYGTTFTFLIALSGSLVSMIIVLVLGVSSAFYSDWWDTIVTRVADALLTFPPFIPLILISTIATPIRLSLPGGYFFAVFLGMSLFTWPLGTRIIRSEVINLLSNEYVEASKQLGAGSWHILRSHILPKIIPTAMILFTYAFTDIILGTTLLGFIGLDSESTLTWGSDLAKAVKYGENLLLRWWTVFFPTIWIFLLVFGLTIFSDSVRDNLDPKLRGGIDAVPYEYRQELEGMP